MLRALFILLTSILILLLIALGTGWYLLRDETFIKQQIEDVVDRETDRSLSIAGPFVVELGESIRISASAISLTDAAWTGRPVMAQVGEMVMRVNSRSLLEDRLEIEEVSFKDCHLTLERSATGERNWDLDPDAPEWNRRRRVDQNVPVILNRVDIRNCQFEHLAPERTEPLRLEVDTLELHRDPQGQLSGNSRGTVNATPFRFSGHFGPPRALWQGGAFVEEIDLELGEISLRSSGRFADGRTGERAQLTLQFSGPEILQVAGYLNLPPFSSGPFDATATIDTRGAVTQVGINGDLGTLEIKAHGEVDRLRDPRQGKLNLDAQGPDLQALGEALGLKGLVRESFQLQGDLEFNEGKVQLKPLKLLTPRDSVEVSGALDRVAGVAGSQFDFRASSQEVDRWAQAWGGQQTKLGAVDLAGKLTWGKDRLQLDGVRIASGADRARLDGELRFARRIAGSRLDVELQLSSMAVAGNRYGLSELPELPLTIDGTVEFTPDRLRSPGLTLVTGLNRAQVSGEMPWTAPLAGFAITWEASGDNLAQFYAIPGFGDWPQDFVSSGSWKRQDQLDRFEEFKLQLGSLSFESDGTLGGTPSQQVVQLQVRTSVPDASKLHLLKRPLPAEPLQVATGLSGSWHDLRFSGLAVTLKNMNLGGDLRYERNKAAGGSGKDRISGRLTSDFVDVSDWLGKRRASQEPEGARKPASSTAPGRVFDDRPVSGFSKSPIDLDLNLDIASADLGSSTLKDVRLDLLWTDDELRLDQVSLRGSKGATLNGFFAIDGRESLPKLELNFRGKELMFGLGALEKQDPSTYPPLELVLDLKGAGKTVHDLVASLNGRIRLFQGSGLFGSARMSILFNDFISELFALLNPFAKQSEYTRLDCSVMAADVNAGLMTITPIIVQTPELTILSQGTIDLATERVDLAFNTKARKGVGISAGTLINPFIKVGGSLSDPAIELDPKGAVLTGGAAVATIGLSLVFKSFTDRFFSSRDPCGDARSRLDELDAADNAASK